MVYGEMVVKGVEEGRGNFLCEFHDHMPDTSSSRSSVLAGRTMYSPLGGEIVNRYSRSL